MQSGSSSFSVDGTTKYGVNVEDKYYGGSSSVSAPQIFQASVFTNFSFSTASPVQTVVTITLPVGLASSKIQATGYVVVAPNNVSLPRTVNSGSFGLSLLKNGNAPMPFPPVPIVSFAPGATNANYLTLPVSLSFTAQGGDIIAISADFQPTDVNQRLLVNNSYLQVVTGFA